MLIDAPHLAQPANARTMASTVMHQLLKDITDGLLQPGARLRIRDTAERYRCGAIPLREALSRLATSGFVVAEDQKGFRVASVSPEELVDLTRVRQMVESEALRDAAANGGVNWESELVAAHHNLSRIPLWQQGEHRQVNPEWEAAHRRFHAALLAGCASPWLRRLSQQFRDQTQRYRFLSAQSEYSTVRDVAAEHKAMVDAILKHDIERAVKLLCSHYQKTTEIVLSQFPKRATQAAAGAPRQRAGRSSRTRRARGRK